MKQIGWEGVGLRFLFALVVVFATYNPEGLSYYHWAVKGFNYGPIQLVVGIVLIIGWLVYIRATARSLGTIGLIVVAALCIALLWLFVDWGLIGLDSSRVVSYSALVIISIILTVGMSWSHIRRQMSGQYDMDDVDEED
jgi:membrane-bound ClpP family serine protease